MKQPKKMAPTNCRGLLEKGKEKYNNNKQDERKMKQHKKQTNLALNYNSKETRKFTLMLE